MCRPASFVVLKGFIPKWSQSSDSHAEIIREYGLCDKSIVNNGRSEAPFVGVEIVPPDGWRFDAPLEQWQFRVDVNYSGILPEWWDREQAEKAVRAELLWWLAERVILHGAQRDVIGPCHVYVLGTAVTVSQGARVAVYDGGTVQAVRSGGTVQAVYSGGTVQAVHSGGTVQAVYSGGTVQAVHSGGTVQRVYGGGTVQAVRSGGTVQAVHSGGTVQRVYGGGTVQRVHGGGTVQTYIPLPDIKLSGSAVLIDRSGDKVQIRLGDGRSLT